MLDRQRGPLQRRVLRHDGEAEPKRGRHHLPQVADPDLDALDLPPGGMRRHDARDGLRYR